MPVKYVVFITVLLFFQPPVVLSAVVDNTSGRTQKLYSLFEEHYLAGSDLSFEEGSALIDSFLAQGETLLLSMERSSLSLLPEKLDKLGILQVRLCGTASADNRFATRTLNFIYKVRRRILSASRIWPGDNEAIKDALFRVLDRGRLASEELLIRLDGLMLSPLVMLAHVPSSTPSAVVNGIKVHSGDVLVSGGGGLVPLLISRGGARRGKYSQSAIIYVDKETGEASVLTAFPFEGTVKTSLTAYLERSNYSALLLRPSPHSARMEEDPLLAHKAARWLFNKVDLTPLSYDHKMDWKDDVRFFPEEMIFDAYKNRGITLWTNRADNNPPGLVRWLDFLGVSNFDLLSPSELEYDNHFIPVVEWFNIDALHEERLLFAVIDALLHSAYMGAEPGYAYDELPLALLAKALSLIDSYRGRQPSIPESLSPFEALRMRTLSEKIIPMLRESTRTTSYWFKKENGRQANYNELHSIAEKILHGSKHELTGIFKTYEAGTPASLR